MSYHKQYIESLIFDNETTTNTDFRKYDIRPEVKTVYKSRKTPRKRTKSPVKYIHTMSDWKSVPVPISLMVERKQILRTNPHLIQKPYVKTPDLEIDEVRRTRPRLVMTPSVSLDDVEDVVKRKLLVDDKYTTHMMKEFGSSKLFSLTAPLRGRYAPAKPLTLAKYTPPHVSPKWRMTSTTWDRRQRRDFCDATKIFWLNRTE